MSELKTKIKSKKARVGVVGLGYTGLPLAIEVAKAGFSTTGVDTNKNLINQIKKGKNLFTGIDTRTLKKIVKSKKLIATLSFDKFSEVDVIAICVPTPLTKAKEPDMTFIIQATNYIAKYLRKGQLVILESTTYPGTTKELVLPILERTRLAVGKDFYLAYSPERVDPGNKKFNIKNTPKIVSGITKNCLSLVTSFYEQVVKVVVPVSSTKGAEMAKLLENIYRSVNIALVNELMVICDRMNVNIWEVINAASTKPFGFTAFKPGPGLGGHCIPIDPFYLAWKVREYGLHTEFIELAGKISEKIPKFVVSKISWALSQQKKCLNGAKILIIGVAYKKNVSDMRESPALRIIELLTQQKAKISYHDPFVEKIEVNNKTFRTADLQNKLLTKSDCVIIVTDHTNINYQKIVKNSPLIIDTRNALAKFSDKKILTI